ncbi:hypothetical protein D3C83_36080 [compost metagenome]
MNCGIARLRMTSSIRFNSSTLRAAFATARAVACSGPMPGLLSGSLASRASTRLKASTRGNWSLENTVIATGGSTLCVPVGLIRISFCNLTASAGSAPSSILTRTRNFLPVRSIRSVPLGTNTLAPPFRHNAKSPDGCLG